jgi:Uma2 family endonuclease
MTTFTLNLNSIIQLTDEQFYQLCQENPDLPLERNQHGELIIVSPVGGESGSQEADLIGDLVDAAWVKLDRWEALSPNDRERFPPLCPDFVIELRSRSDRLKPLQDKMQEYLVSGLRLGWLIDPQNQQVEIYRAGQAVEIVKFPARLSGEEVLPGFLITVL